MNPRIRLACCLLAAALIATLFVSAPSTGGLILPPWDKLAHLVFYGALAVLLTVALGPKRWVASLLAVCLIGIADEAYQSLLPGRHADWGDLAADFVAAAAGAWITRWYLMRGRPPG
ncbi:MAG: VanZ family protein [Burkholderiales bacterium]